MKKNKFNIKQNSLYFFSFFSKEIFIRKYNLYNLLIKKSNYPIFNTIINININVNINLSFFGIKKSCLLDEVDFLIENTINKIEKLMLFVWL